MRVKMKDFVTYQDVEVRPGGKMNVVLGPNGSGKSTIVSALCLGLGGEPKDLSRKVVHDFIRTGCDYALVEIDICKSEGYLDECEFDTVSRTIVRTNAKSEWKWNGQRVDEASARRNIKAYDIQVDNLCQFLPQDRVSDFAGLTPEALLKETEKAVSGQNLMLKHEELIKERDSLKLTSNEADKLQKELDDLKASLADLEPQIRLYDEYQKLEEELKIIQLKELYLQLEVKKKEAQEKRSKWQELQTHYDNLQAQLQPKQREVEECKKQVFAAKQMSQAAKSSLSTLTRNRDDLMQEYKSAYSDIEDINNQMEASISNEKMLKKTIADRKKKIADLTQQMNRAIATETRENERSELQQKRADLITFVTEAKNRCRDFSLSLSTLNRRKDATRASIAQEEERKMDGLRNLKNVDPNCLQAYYHIQELSKSGRFKEKVYGPTCIELTVADEAFARAIEQQIPSHIFFGFIAQNPDDYRLLASEFADRFRNSRVSCILYKRSEDVARHSHPVPIDVLKRFGAISYLDSVIQAPPPVMHVLKDTSYITKVLVGESSLAQHSTELLHQYQIVKFFTRDTEYMSTQSRYGARAISTRSTAIRDPRILKSNRHESVEKLTSLRRSLEELEANIQTVGTSLAGEESRLAAATREMEQINDQLQNINTAEKQRKALAAQLQRERSELDKDMNRPSAEEERLTLQEKCLQVCKNRLKIQENFATTCNLLMEKCTKVELAELQYHSLHRKEVRLSSELTKESERLSDLKEEVRRAEVDKNNTMLELKALDSHFKNEDKNAKLTKEQQERMMQLPQNLPELNSEKAGIIARKSAMHNIGSNEHQRLVKQMTEKKDRIVVLEAKLGRETSNVESRRELLEKKRRDWLDPLRELVARVNSKFEDYMEGMGVAGRVELFVKDDAFELYALHLMVRYRENEDFQVLAKHRQSGGERSVATMLFLFALQSEAPCPFRVVDEINQGVDAQNERKIFNLMSDLSTRPSVPQYFMVTPKLLPGINFCESTAVLFVYNGPFALAQNEWPDEVAIPSPKKKKTSHN